MQGNFNEIFSLLVTRFYEQSQNDNDRYRSWEHCYRVFNQFKDPERRKNVKDCEYDILALHLGFYLASWGMYRGSSFLLKKDYKVHINPIKCIFDEEYSQLWERYNPELGLQLIGEMARKYGAGQRFVEVNEIDDEEVFGSMTDTLFTKILLGTYGNIPAYDRYCKTALSRLSGNGNSLFDKENGQYVGTSRTFAWINELSENIDENRLVFTIDNSTEKYTKMKIIDMFLFEYGNALEAADNLSKNESTSKVRKAIAFFCDVKRECQDPEVFSNFLTSVFSERRRHNSRTYIFYQSHIQNGLDSFIGKLGLFNTKIVGMDENSEDYNRKFENTYNEIFS